MTTDTEITPKKSNRGRKPIPFTFPAGEFKVKDLAAQYDVSVPFIHIKMKNAGDRVKKLRDERVAGRKGRSAGVYQYEAPSE